MRIQGRLGAGEMAREYLEVGIAGSVSRAFAASWFLRVDSSLSPTTTALVLSFAGAGLALFTGWLGGELVVQHAIGVNDEANLNAPSSIHRPVHRTEPVIRPR